MSLMKTICMKCQSLFSEKNKQNIELVSAEFVQSVEKVNTGILSLLVDKYPSTKVLRNVLKSCFKLSQINCLL